MLLDLDFGSEPRKLLVQANRNGFFYVLDRTNGKFLLAKPFIHVTWAKEIGPDGRPVVLPGTSPRPEGSTVCPGVFGGTNWMSPSYNPHTRLCYVVVREECATYYSKKQTFEEGRLYWAGTFHSVPDQKAWGALRALDPRTGKIRWEFKYHSPTLAGTLSTAGGLVFAGGMDGYLMAFNAETGRDLWHFQTGAAIYASPITYAVDGQQYIAISSQSALLAFALPGNASAR